MDSSQRMFLSRLNKAFPQSQLKYFKQLVLDQQPFLISSNSESLLASLTRSLAHLTAPLQQSQGLAIQLFTGLTPSLTQFFRWIKSQYGSLIVRVNCQEYSLYYNPGVDGSFPCMSFISRVSNRAIYWVVSETEIPWYERAAPLRMILRWHFTRLGYTLLHGATVSVGGYGALIIGKGGKGKTTTALTAFQAARLKYVSDDYTLVKIGDRVMAYCLYSSAKVRVEKSGLDHETDKQTLYYADSPKLSIACQLVALLVPEIGHAKISFSRLSSPQALMYLAPSTLLQLFPEDDDQSSFVCMTQLVVTLPSYLLKLSSQMTAIGDALTSFLEPVLVSVILPAYNAQNYIEEAISSLKLALKAVSYEIIVIDDGSTDQTREIISRDPSLILLTQARGGPSSARNKGLRIARGRYISFIDADDVWTNDHFTYLVDLLNQDQKYMVALGYTQRYHGVNQALALQNQTPSGPPILMPTLGCGLFKSEIFSLIGFLNEKYHWHEDIDWYLRLREQNIPLIIGKKVVKYYRLHAHNTTKDWASSDKKILTVLASSLKRRRGTKIPALSDFSL